MSATTRQRAQSERNSHEVYYRGEPVHIGLTKREAQQHKRALMRRERKRDDYRR